MVDIPDEIALIKTPIKAFPLSEDEKDSSRRFGIVLGGVFLILLLALGVNWALSHLHGSRNNYEQNNPAFWGK